MQSPQHAADLPAYVAVLILFKQRRDDNTQEVAQPLVTSAGRCRRSCPTEQFVAKTASHRQRSRSCWLFQTRADATPSNPSSTAPNVGRGLPVPCSSYLTVFTKRR